MDRRLQRRDALRLLFATSIIPTFTGCPRSLREFCPDDPVWTNPAADLTIDVHSHMFNASDLPVAPFLSLVAIRQSNGLGELVQLFGDVLQFLGWHLAPSADAERQQLGAISREFEHCDLRKLPTAVRDVRQRQYLVAKRELERGKATVMQAGGPSGLIRGENFQQRRELLEFGLVAIDRLMPTYEAQHDQAQEEAQQPHLLRRTPQSLLLFVIEMFQYRYASFFSYLESYSQGKRHSIDLVGSALVDYDWWLAKGRPTPSSLRAQMDLMGALAAKTRGRVHAWAPFCPFREVMYRRKKISESSLSLVQTAVTSQGALGVKLYPPMGFAPLGNADLPADFWRHSDWLSEDAHSSTFGEEMDGALRDLYTFCTSYEVPVLAHANNSNGASDAFQDLALAPHWVQVLSDSAFRDLRVDFGHFGGAGSKADIEQAKAFVNLMGPPGQAGAHTYADASYFSELLEQPGDLQRVIQSLFGTAVDRLHLLKQRFLFGTDWKMLLAEANASSYVERFEKLLDQLPEIASLRRETGLRQRFFAENAVDFLGLRRGAQARTRLEQFYAARGVKTPGWMTKVDAAS